MVIWCAPDMVFKLMESGAMPLVIMHGSQSILHHPIQLRNLAFIYN